MTAHHIPASSGPRVAARDVLLQVRGLRAAVCQGGAVRPVLDDVNFDLRRGERLGVLGETDLALPLLARALTGRPAPGDRVLAGTARITTGTAHHLAAPGEPAPGDAGTVTLHDPAVLGAPHAERAAAGPRVLVADLTALPPDEAMARTDRLRETAPALDEDGIALIVVGGRFETVAGFCDTLQVVAGGRIVERGPAAELRARPRHRLTVALRAGAAAPPHGARTGRGCFYEPHCLRGRGHDSCRHDLPGPAPFVSPHGSVTVKCHFPAPAAPTP
ncbi:hypothetical protein ACH4C2_00955 [Streptomyces sp. NPDC018057]|uniref:hypothetical protein n=1 Tax=unclassified Streptomyces TaxID=2593676 RepID=UPI0037ADA5D9